MASGAEGGEGGTGGQEVVLPHACVLIMSHCDTDEEFIKGERFLDSCIFGETAVPWSILWGHIDEFVQATGSSLGNNAQTAEDTVTPAGQQNGAGPYRPEWLNSDDFRMKVRTFLSRARVIARRLYFCAYWVLDEARMADWLFVYARGNAAEREQLPAPFGVIEPSDALFGRVLLQSKELMGASSRATTLSRLTALWYHPAILGHNVGTTSGLPEGVPKGIKTGVFMDYAPRLVRPTPGQYYELIEAADKSYKNLPSINFARFGSTNDSGPALNAQNCLIPGSAIFSLMRDKSRILEAQFNLAQAEGAAIQSGVILNSKRPKMDSATDVNPAPDELMDTETRMDGMLQNVYKTQVYTWERWKERWEEVQRMQNPDYDRQREGQKTSTDRHRLAYGRPARFENQLTLVEGIEVGHVTEPKVLTDLEAVQTKYCEDVAELLGLVPPRTITQQSGTIKKQQQGAGKDGAGGPLGLKSIYSQQRDTPMDNHFQHVIQNERNWVVQLFGSMYRLAFHDLDMMALDELFASVQEERAHMKEARLALKALEKELRREIAARAKQEQQQDDSLDEEDPAEKKLKQLQKEAGTKQQRQTVRVKVRVIREYVEYLRSRPDAVARLEFRPGMTERHAQQLDMLLALMDKGLVKAVNVQPYFEAIFPGVPLHDPPAPEPAGGAGTKKANK